jgi:hypothetical protein
MTKNDNLIAGIGIGLVVAAFFAKVFNDLMWFVLSTGILLLILGATGLLTKSLAKPKK